MSPKTSETSSAIVGYRAGDRRINPHATYEADRCDGCDHLVWFDVAEREGGKRIRCTVCLAADGVKLTA